MSVAFIREDSAEAAREVSLPPRPVSVHPNLVTATGLRGLEQGLAASREAMQVARALDDANERRRAMELPARDARYFSERIASAILRTDPAGAEIIAFGHRVTIARDDGRTQTFRIVGEDEADPRAGSIAYVSPLARRLIGRRAGEAITMDGHDIEVLAIG